MWVSRYLWIQNVHFDFSLEMVTTTYNKQPWIGLLPRMFKGCTKAWVSFSFSLKGDKLGSASNTRRMPCPFGMARETDRGRKQLSELKSCQVNWEGGAATILQELQARNNYNGPRSHVLISVSPCLHLCPSSVSCRQNSHRANQERGDGNRKHFLGGVTFHPFPVENRSGVLAGVVPVAGMNASGLPWVKFRAWIFIPVLYRNRNTLVGGVTLYCP